VSDYEQDAPAGSAHEHADEHGAHAHDHEGHDHDHGHDHTLITDRLPAGRWHVDSEGSEVLFKGRTLFGLIPVNGEFGSFAGVLEVEPDGSASGRLAVQAESLSSGIARRDKHLRSNDFFGVSEHPELIFELDQILPSGEDHLDVTGELQIRDITIPLAFTIYAIAHGDHLHIEGRVDIDTDAAGLGWSKPLMVSAKARADVALTLARGA
jgi:polyisoprenoid-binding protein YceI